MTPILKRILRSTAIRISLFVLVVLLVAWLIVPQVLTLRYQSRAGTIMESVVQREASDYEDHFTCLLPVLADLPEDAETEIAQSIMLLRRASRVTPNNAHTDFMLGKAYCLLQNYEEAIESLEAYHRKRPKNPLGLMEKGFAYFSWAQTLGENQEAMRITYLDRSVLALEEAGIGIEGALLINHGDIAYEHADYKTAWVWYELAANFGSLPTELDIRCELLELVYAQETYYGSYFDERFFKVLEDELVIQPSEFFRLRTGWLVHTQQESGQVAGLYFSNTCDGGILLEVIESHQYCVTIKALDRPPEPTLLRMDIDFELFLEMELTQGDDVWVTFEKAVFMEEGMHLLSIGLLNDYYVEGVVDRNGYVGPVKIAICPNN